MDFLKRINVEANLKDNLSSRMNQMNTAVSRFGYNFGNLQKIQQQFGLRLAKSGKTMMQNNQRIAYGGFALDNYITKNADFFDALNLNNQAFKRINTSGMRYEKVTARFANRIRMATQGLRGFKMELLGTMFFGMSLWRTMVNLTSTSMEWVGIFDILSTTLGLLFLPLALDLLERFFLPFLKLVQDLNPETKKFIGYLVLFVGLIGAGLTFIGAMGLGIGALISAFAKFLLPIKLVFILFSSLWSIVSFLVTGLFSLLTSLGLIGVVFSLIIGIGILGFFGSLADELGPIGEKITTLGIDGSMITKLKDKIVEISEKAWNWIKDNLPIWFQKGADMLTSIIKGVEEKLPEIKTVVENIASTMATFVSENIGSFINIGIGIGSALIQGIRASIPDWAIVLLSASAGAIAGGHFGGVPGAVIGATTGAVAAGAAITTLDYQDMVKKQQEEFNRSMSIADMQKNLLGSSSPKNQIDIPITNIYHLNGTISEKDIQNLINVSTNNIKREILSSVGV